MMFNDQYSGGARNAEPTGDQERLNSDREVPFGPRAEIADAVHAWLDGLAPEREVRRAEWSHEVELWKRIDHDLAHRRKLKTPAGLNARIMSAIPRHVPAVMIPWWKREFAVTAYTAMLALLTAIALTAFVTASVIR